MLGLVSWLAVLTSASLSSQSLLFGYWNLLSLGVSFRTPLCFIFPLTCPRVVLKILEHRTGQLRSLVAVLMTMSRGPACPV